MFQEKDVGYSKLTGAMEAGEKLYPNTATAGRDDIRQKLRTLKQDWDTLYDDVSSSQRELDVKLVQWTSYEDSSQQLLNWLSNMEGQLKGSIPLMSTLDEKKKQQQAYRVRIHLTFTALMYFCGDNGDQRVFFK